MARKKSKTLTWLVIITVVLIIFAIVGKKAGWIGKEKLPKVAVEKVTLNTITETVSANGKIQPEIEVKISPDVSGEIIDLYVKEGDSVRAGDLLVRINPDIYLTNLERNEAALNNAKANLSNMRSRLVQTEAKFAEAEANYKRNVSLHKEKVISDAEFESIKANYLTARAEVDATRESIKATEFSVKSQAASLDEANKTLKRTTIFSPVNGVISKLNIEKGERVVGTSQMAGTELMRIANLNEMEVSVDVSENDIVRVSLGDTADIEVEAYQNRKFKGIVTEIANSANVAGVSAEQVTNFPVKIRILRESYIDISSKMKGQSAFRPGMTASVEIRTETVKNAISIPVEAVTLRPENENDSEKNDEEVKEEDSEKKEKKEAEEKKDDKEVVFVFKDGKVSKVEVKTGIQDTRFIQVISGLSKDQEVVTAPSEAISKTLKDGKAVEKVEKEKLFEIKEK